MWLPKKPYNGKDPQQVAATAASVCAGQVLLASLVPPFPLLVIPTSLLLVLWLTYMPAKKKSLSTTLVEPTPTIRYVNSSSKFLF
jgi:hypothetical protein